MHARVVRFTDVDAARIEERMSPERIEEEGPPEGVPVKGIQVIHDPEQRTAIVIQLFETAEDMSASEAAFSGMDPSETPGTRESVDRGEIMLDLKV